MVVRGSGAPRTTALGRGAGGAYVHAVFTPCGEIVARLFPR